MSHRIRLSLEETYLLADKMQQVTNKKLSRRLLAISLRHFGYKVKDIAQICDVSERTVTKWMKLFLDGGFDALLTQHYPTQRGSRLQPYHEDIRAFWQSHPDARLEDLQAFLANTHGIEVEYSWLYRYLELHQLRAVDG